MLCSTHLYRRYDSLPSSVVLSSIYILLPVNSTSYYFFFLNDPATPEFYPLPLHDALPIYEWLEQPLQHIVSDPRAVVAYANLDPSAATPICRRRPRNLGEKMMPDHFHAYFPAVRQRIDRKSTRLNSSHT